MDVCYINKSVYTNFKHIHIHVFEIIFSLRRIIHKRCSSVFFLFIFYSSCLLPLHIQDNVYSSVDVDVKRVYLFCLIEILKSFSLSLLRFFFFFCKAASMCNYENNIKVYSIAKRNYTLKKLQN